MKFNLFKQAWAQMKAQKMLSIISVIGTALSIFLIMVVVMLQQVKTAPFAPESCRDRLLLAQYGSLVGTENKNWGSNGAISYETARKLFGNLPTAQEVSIISPYFMRSNIGLPTRPSKTIDSRATDDAFWRIFDFTFIDGKPYDKAAFDAGIPMIVITESVARAVFGTTSVSGKEVLLDHVPFTVAGVVKDVSPLASTSYAQAWMPFTATNVVHSTWNSGIMGSLGTVILARDRNDFAAIRAEYEENLKKLNTDISSTGWEMISLGRPYDQEKAALASSSNNEPDVEAARRQRLIVFLILLIVPAINLSGMTESRLRKRIEEIGVRRAFGSTRGELFSAILGENLILTLAAGIIGWLLSIAFAFIFSTNLFAQGYVSVSPKIDIAMLVRPATFLWALFFCFILNLLSSGLPAWKASRANVVNALNAK